MKLLILTCTLTCAFGKPMFFKRSSIDDTQVQDYRSAPLEETSGGGSGFVNNELGSGLDYGSSEKEAESISVNLGKEGRTAYGSTCPEGQIPDGHGICAQPDVTRNVYVYSSPEIPPVYGPPPPVPRPKVNYNVVFVRTPEQPKEPEPVVVPPPQQKTLVYVLTKNDQKHQQVIEIPAGPEETPSVFYVNYNEGDNPTLLGDISLSDVLTNPGEKGQVVTGGGYAAPPPHPPPPPQGYY